MPNDNDGVVKRLAGVLDECERRRSLHRAAGLPALNRLVAVAQRDTGQSVVVGRFLLGLYNGPRYPFDLTSLRGLDDALFDDCLAVLRMDQCPEKEVHQLVEDGDAIWRTFRERFVLTAEV